MTQQLPKQTSFVAKQLGLPKGLAASDDSIEEVKPKKYNAKEVAHAIRSVVNYIVSDAFNLSEEEHMWLGYQLAKIMKPLEFINPSIVLGAVRRELNTKEYSERLFNYKPSSKIFQPAQKAVRTATLEDWTTVISSAILSSYPEARPMVQASVIGSVYGMLQELGLTNDVDESRQSMYLPNAVRYALNTRR